MPKVTINDTEIEVEKGTSILKAAAQAGYEVPHFCYHPALSIPANCRMCLVEVEGAPDLEPACYSEVSDGMVVKTESERVVKAQKAVLEFILLNHPVDCAICDQAGECKLQDYYMAYDAQESRLRAEKNQKVKAYPIGPDVIYDGERCILCTRCIRFCDEITGTNELRLAQRGDSAEIRTFPGKELDNNYSVCTVDICPVGALTQRDFRFKCRVWLLTSTDSICTGCAKGCNIHLDHFRNEIQRYKPRFNPEVNDYWMCDEGRLTYKEVHEDRLLEPMNNGVRVNWHGATETAGDKLEAAIGDDTSSFGFVLSPQASCEDLYLAKRFADEALDVDNLFLGGKPDGFEDDFLIEADKNPNRRGVEAVFGGFDDIADIDTLVDQIEAGEITTLYMMETRLPVDDETTDRFVEAVDQLDLFVLQSRHQGRLASKAHLALPACSHAETEGTFVNADGIAQGFDQAFEPHGNSLPHWQIFLKLARRMDADLGYTFIDQIRDEMFSASSSDDDQEQAAQTPAE